MTAIRTDIPTAGRRAARNRGSADLVGVVLGKPTDEVALLDLGARLNGRPVPGLRMSEAEFERWADSDVRAEWVDGEVILMPPVSFEQTDLQGWLCAIVRQFVEERELGKVVGPEFTVRLPRQRRRRLPDLLFIAEARVPLIRPTFVDGPPDAAFEIVSPDSVVRDWREKYQEYEAAGVREYWVIDPTTRRAEAYTLARRKYALIPEIEGRINSKVLGGFHLRPEWFWKSPLPRVAAVLRELGVGRR